MWAILYTKEALRDFEKIHQLGLIAMIENIVAIETIVASNPWEAPPAFKRLHGQLVDFHARRISLEHRFIYQIYKKERLIKVVSLWGHFT